MQGYIGLLVIKGILVCYYVNDGTNAYCSGGGDDNGDGFCVLGLVAEGEKVQKQTGGLVVTKDLMGNVQQTQSPHVL